MVNIKSINQMMTHHGYRQITKIKSRHIATFVVKNSPMWKA